MWCQTVLLELFGDHLVELVCFEHDFLQRYFYDVVDPDESLAFGGAFTHFIGHARAHARETYVNTQAGADLVLKLLFAVTLDGFQLHLVLRLAHDLALHFPDVEHQHIRVVQPVHGFAVHILPLH